MCLTTKQIAKKTKDYKCIKELYHTAFPKYEQNPLPLFNKWLKDINAILFLIAKSLTTFGAPPTILPPPIIGVDHP